MSVTEHALHVVQVAARAASDKLGQKIVAYDVSETLAITEAFVLASAPNDRSVRAIVDEIEDQLREQLQEKPLRREGHRGGRWVLLDYADVVIHVQHSDEREFYALERLWRDCPEIELSDDIAPPTEVAERAADETPVAEFAGQDQDTVD